MNSYPAKWWTALDDGAVRCELCPRRCVIPKGGTGYCCVRRNCDGELRSLSYGHPVSIAIDPIEKKPLARFLPGTRTLSFGTYGCNLGCLFCQNDSLSRGCYSHREEPLSVPPQRIVELALQHGCPSLSYTYNEPTVFAEYVLDIARLAHDAGLKNVLVSNGFISDEAAGEMYPLLDAANIDMKGWDDDFYPTMCAATLPPVLSSLKRLRALGVHLEVTTLVIPGKNDSEEAIQGWLDWAARNLGLETPLHFSAYFPAYRCTIPPTPPDTLFRIQRQAHSAGFRNVFLGNIRL